MAIHSSMFAWRIPLTAEPGGTVHRVAKSRTQLKQLSTHARTLSYYMILVRYTFDNILSAEAKRNVKTHFMVEL